MLFLVAAAFSLQAASPPPARLDPTRPTPTALTDSLEAVELRFFYEWGAAFKLSQGPRREFLQRLGVAPDTAWRTARTTFLHCRYKSERGLDSALVAGWRAVASAEGFYAVCPSWSLGDSLAYDERNGVDVALDARFRGGVHDARASVLAVFDRAAQALPANDWIIGQRVRLLVDQHELPRALETARSCQARRVWCNELTGYTLALHGEFAAADSAFEAAMVAMSPTERCAWTNIAVLLEDDQRTAYNKLPCTQRDSLSRVVWWLANPLYINPGNERRVEHYAREVAVALRNALDRDERWDWRAPSGGDALGEMVVRYGWPSYTYWGGPENDLAHSGYLLLYHSAINPPYTTFEYATGRLQTFPLWEAIADPFHARSSDWTISASKVPTPRPIANNTADVIDAHRQMNSVVWLADEEDVLKHVSQWWWPRQHFAPRFPTEQLPDGEVAFLRRQTNDILAVAVDLPSAALARKAGETVDATLLVTPQPDSIRVVARQTATIGTPLTMHGAVTAQPAIVGIEFPAAGAAGPPAGRTRFGATPPPALSAMRAGELAISDLIVLRAPLDGAPLPNDAEHALPLMTPSARMHGVAHLGVYWETYGLAPTDSVEIGVWIERYTPQGILRQFGIALNIARDLNTPVTMSWKESGGDPRASVIAGPVPIIGHSVVLDASQLTPGDYWLDVVVRRPGAPALRSRRSFSVQAP